MNSPRGAPLHLQGLPTLTEVIVLPERAVAPEAPVEAVAPPEAPAVEQDAGVAALDEDRLVRQVLGELQRQAELMLEYRLREAITPALSRLSDALVRELRQELGTTLRDVVARAVSQELARRRER